MSTATMAPPQSNGTATADPWEMKVPEPGGNFELPPSGNHAAICFGVIDLGTHAEDFQGERKEAAKFCYLFETPSECDSKGDPFTFAIQFTKSLHEKAKVRKFLESWRGKPFAVGEVVTFSSCLGKPCLLNVTHSAGKKDKTYANAGAATPMPKGMPIPRQFRDTLTYSILDIRDGVEPPDEEWMPRTYGQKLADVVKESKEWRAAKGLPAKAAPAATQAEIERDDDIPF